MSEEQNKKEDLKKEYIKYIKSAIRNLETEMISNDPFLVLSKPSPSQKKREMDLIVLVTAIKKQIASFTGRTKKEVEGEWNSIQFKNKNTLPSFIEALILFQYKKKLTEEKNEESQNKIDFINKLSEANIIPEEQLEYFYNVGYGGDWRFFPFRKLPKANGTIEVYKKTWNPGNEYTFLNDDRFSLDAYRNSIQENENDRILFRFAYNVYINGFIPNDHQVEPLSESKWLASIINDFKNDMDYTILPHRPTIITDDPKEPTFKYLNLPKVDPDMETPYWNQFLERVSEPSLFMQWIGNLFDPKNTYNRQVLYMQGEGGDGKSQVLKVIEEFYGNYASLDRKSIDSEFVGSQIFGKGLLTIPDCKSPSIIGSELIHRVTGGDTLMINTKFMTPFTAKCYAKVWINSNDKAQIRNVRNEKSRIIYLEVSEPKGKKDKINWTNELRKELPVFIAQCRRVYEDNRIEGEPNIPIPESYWDEVLPTITIERFADILEWLEVNYEFNSELSISKETLTEDFSMCYWDDKSAAKRDLFRIMQSKGVKEKRKTVNGVKRRVLYGIGKKINLEKVYGKSYFKELIEKKKEIIL